MDKNNDENTQNVGTVDPDRAKRDPHTPATKTPDEVEAEKNPPEEQK